MRMALGRAIHWVSDELHLLAHLVIGDPDWRARNGYNTPEAGELDDLASLPRSELERMAADLLVESYHAADEWWRFVEHLADDQWTPGCKCDHCKDLRPFFRRFSEMVNAENGGASMSELAREIEAMPHWRALSLEVDSSIVADVRKSVLALVERETGTRGGHMMEPVIVRSWSQGNSDTTVRGMVSHAAHKSLRWVCLGCGQGWKIEMPGFPGSTIGGYHWHVFDQERGVNCSGPLIAVIAKDATDAGC